MAVLTSTARYVREFCRRWHIALCLTRMHVRGACAYAGSKKETTITNHLSPGSKGSPLPSFLSSGGNNNSDDHQARHDITDAGTDPERVEHS